MTILPAEVIQLSTPFEHFVHNVIENAKILVSIGKFSPRLYIYSGALVDNLVEVWEVPEGHTAMASFFVDRVEDARSRAQAYMFITESWALSVNTEDMREIKKYIENPSLIVDNPFKEERLVFKVVSSREGESLLHTFSGYVEVERDDAGRAVIGNTFVDEDDDLRATEDIADLLLPMLQ